MAGLRGVRPMRLIVLLTACACAVALLAPIGAGAASGSGAGWPAAVPPSAKAAPPQYRAAYRQWRGRLRQHGLYVGRDLLGSGEARASDERAAAPTKRELRRSIHRMQKRWGRWLRHDPQGRAVAFKLKVRSEVPSWGKAQLRSIAWCESKNDPRDRRRWRLPRHVPVLVQHVGGRRRFRRPGRGFTLGADLAGVAAAEPPRQRALARLRLDVGAGPAAPAGPAPALARGRRYSSSRTTSPSSSRS